MSKITWKVDCDQCKKRIADSESVKSSSYDLITQAGSFDVPLHFCSEKCQNKFNQNDEED